MNFEIEVSNNHVELLALYLSLTGNNDRSSDYYEVKSRQRRSDSFFQYAFIKQDGVNIGLAEFGINIHNNSSELGFLWIAVDPEFHDINKVKNSITHIENVLSSRDFKKVSTFTSDSFVKNCFIELGYHFDSEMVETTHELQSFESCDVPSWKVGYQVRSFSQLFADQGDDIYKNLLKFIQDILIDTPGQEIQAQNLEARFIKESWNGSHFMEDGCFILEHEGVPVGIHNLVSFTKNEVTAGLTGILRPYRRQGFMTQLKTHAMIWAAQNGFTQYRSHNESNNPMLTLNLKLGFSEIGRAFELSKSLNTN
jgi:GNAT superfamily N-acetyltransferase